MSPQYGTSDPLSPRVAVGNVEVEEPAAGESRHVPADACGATFTRAPKAARNSRTLAPCLLKRGHTGSHENENGVSWSQATSARRQISTRTDQKGDSTMTTTELKARMKRMQRVMANRTASDAQLERSIPIADGPLARAAQAVSLARAPQWGWLASERRVVLERLTQAGDALLRHALDTRATDTAHRREIEELRRQVVAAGALLAPGVATDVQQETLDTLSEAIMSLHKPLNDEARLAANFARRLAEGKQAQETPAPAAPQHPWFTHRHVA
ncbi:hypothetical protein [Streptomyces sp. NRRL S-118]|uniref:hypothetical protein n=1 Tax=Streptomyces sp. NRRL S-118 TaxID=1463881 RepID=UPI0004C9BDD9|nr:hypothetical protein [Streptomyces sp. NRRL S-118]